MSSAHEIELSPREDSMYKDQSVETPMHELDFGLHPPSHKDRYKRPPDSASPRSFALLLVVLCVTMHTLLVIGFLVLVILRWQLQGDAVSFSSNKLNYVTGHIFYYATMYPKTILQVYLIPAVFVTQKLAFRQTIHVKQSLTAIHDKALAWLGLGATASVLWQYKDLFRKKDPVWKEDLMGFGGVVCILLYLGGGWFLGYIAADLVVPGQTVGNATSYQPLTQYVPSVGKDVNQIQEAFPIVNIIPLLSVTTDVTTTGLQDYIIYDVPNFATTAEIPVNALQFSVQCKAVPTAKQAGEFNAQNSSFSIHVIDSLQNINVTPISRGINIRAALWSNISDKSPPPSTILIASTFDIVDDYNSTVSPSADLNVPVTPITCPVPSDCPAISSVQIIACDVGYTQGAVNVFTASFPIETDSPTDPVLSNIGHFGDLSPASHTTQYFQIADSDVKGNYTFTMLEDMLMETLGVYSPSFHTASLGFLEYVLAQSVAAVMWRGALRIINDAPEPGTNNAYDTRFAITISKWTPWLGLFASTTMLIVVIIVTRQPKSQKGSSDDGADELPKVSGFGVLQLIWLLGHSKRNRDYATRMGEIPDPTVGILRKEGKEITARFAD